MNLINNAGGIAVLAHPGLIKDDMLVENLLDNYNFQGLEVYYPQHTPMQIAKYLAWANIRNLLVSGGSDFHGVSGRYPSKLGVFSISNEINKDLIAWKTPKLTS